MRYMHVCMYAFTHAHNTQIEEEREYEDDLII